MATIDQRPTQTELLEPVTADTIDRDDKSSYHDATTEEQRTTEEAASSSLVQQAPRFTAFSNAEKVTTIYIVSFVAMISPLAGAIYYPALPTLAKHYHVSNSVIQLTITIFQGIAPSFIANWSDSYGRKPAYMICFLIFLGANIGLALQNSFAALMVLRCLQSSGSSVTVPLSAGTVADVSTRAERGKFIAYASLGVTLGPALGPIIGGLLIQFLDWRAVFWFLAIFTGAVAPGYFLLVPETARSVVGRGDIPPPRLLMTMYQWYQHCKLPSRTDFSSERATLRVTRKRANPLAALKILAGKEGGLTLGFGAIVFGGYYIILTTVPATLEAKFGFNAIQVGLAYLPLFVGSIFSRSLAGRFMDRNFKRHAKRAGIDIHKGRQVELDKMPIEAARLQVSIPMVYASGLCIIAYGWVAQRTSSLAGMEIMLFFVGLFTNGSLSGLNSLVVDTHQESPATAMAANNLFRCLLSAGCVAFATPLIEAIGFGWTGVLIAGIWFIFSPAMWLVMIYGEKWREQDEKTRSEKLKKKDEKQVQSEMRPGVDP